MKFPISKIAILGLLLTGFIACGGGSDPAAPLAKGLAYTNPTGTGWRLVKDSSSTSTHLVLNLLGPATSKSRGVGFNLEGEGAVKFSKFSNGLYVQDGGTYELFNLDAAVPGSPDDSALLNGGVKGTLLSVGIFQKDRRLTAKDHGGPLLRIAMDFDPATTGLLNTGTPLSFQIKKAKIIPEDIGDYNDWASVKAKSKMEDITIAIGTLKAE